MVLEAIMLCLDNSEWMRNGDYHPHPTRLEAQADVASFICAVKTQKSPENTVGVLAMAGDGVRVIVTHTNDPAFFLMRMQELEIGGEANLTTAIQVAQLALKHRRNKNLQQRIIVFAGSPLKCEKNELEAIGKNLKKNNVALDVVDFGESDNEKPEKLEALVTAANSDGNSHIIHIPPGENLYDILVSSPILGTEGSTSAASRASEFEFGVDPNADPELALALRISLEEERARQEVAAKKAAEESSGSESKGLSSTSDGDTVMDDAEPAPNPNAEYRGDVLTDDKYHILQQAHAKLIEACKSGAVCADDAETIEIPANYFDSILALQKSVQEGEMSTQSDTSEMFGNEPFVQSITFELPGVDVIDLSNKDSGDLLALLNRLREDVKDKILQQAHAMAIEDCNSGPVCADYAQKPEILANDPESILDLERSPQEGETGTQSGTSEVFGNQPSMQSVTYGLPGVEVVDPSNKDMEQWLSLSSGSGEPKKKHRKLQKKKQQTKQKRKHEKKEDKPEDDKSQ